MEMLLDIQQKLEALRVEKIVVNTEEVAAMFGKRSSSGYRIVATTGFPAPIHKPGVIGRVWLKEDVEQWARTQQIRSERLVAV